ncbi:mandelate racemase/muconate lactonizing enzyme family protein [Roseibium sp.]|uniref:mandelate racemase/muconate lactonizing enzyme family protein n=1 Tax=Roseibium sp. TaxID=1936156 RepID=UPI0025D4C407|nr:enolase C-terminal domain-like protein [Roseibium sp.]
MTNFPDFRISGLTLWRVPLTSHETYYMASGKTCATVDSMVLRIETDQGISGWGEVCPIPHYLPAYANGVAPALEELAPVLIGANPVGVDALMAACRSHLLGHRYAQSAIDIALWDLTGKACGVPVYTLLGGRQNQDLPLYHSITCIAPEEMARIAKEAIAAGMRQIQVKLGADDNWEADVARLRLVREAVGTGPLVYGDWNCGATRLDATRVGRAVSDLDIMLEQPCATLEECAAVRHATNLPMKLDENAHDTATLLKAYELGCMDAVALKLSKFGGISELRRARDLCLYFGARMCIEDTWGSDVATAAALHVAAATPAKAIMNVCDLSGYVSPRIDADAPVRSKGRISPPVGPGLGVWPDADALGAPVLSIAA